MGDCQKYEYDCTTYDLEHFSMLAVLESSTWMYLLGI